MREVSSFLSTVHPLIWKPRLDMWHPQGWWDLQNIVVPMVKRLIFLEMRDNIGSVALISRGRGWIRGSWTAMVMDGELIAAKKGELLQVIAASPLHTDAHSCTHMHTDTHKCTQTHKNARRLLQLKVHRPFKCISTSCIAQVRASRDYSDHEASPLLWWNPSFNEHSSPSLWCFFKSHREPRNAEFGISLNDFWCF